MDIYVKTVVDGTADVFSVLQNVYKGLDDFYLRDNGEYDKLLSSIKLHTPLSKYFLVETALEVDSSYGKIIRFPDNYLTINEDNKDMLNTYSTYNRLVYFYVQKFYHTSIALTNVYNKFFDKVIRGDDSFYNNIVHAYMDKVISAVKIDTLNITPENIDTQIRLNIISYFVQAMSNIRAFENMANHIIKYVTTYTKNNVVSDHHRRCNDKHIILKDIERSVRKLEWFTTVVLFKLLKQQLVSISITQDAHIYRELAYLCLTVGEGTMKNTDAIDKVNHADELNMDSDDGSRLFQPTYYAKEYSMT